MKLSEALNNIHSFDDEAGIFSIIDSELSLDTEVTLVKATNGEDPIAPIGMHEIISVYHAQETLNGLKQLLKGQTGHLPTETQLLERFLVYLENGA